MHYNLPEVPAMPNMTIRLPEEKMNRLRLAASRRNKSASKIVEEAIDSYLPKLSGPSLADVLQDYIGAAGDGPPTDSSRISEVFGEILEQKHREGHL
jgi:predicted DNA-binding protein